MVEITQEAYSFIVHNLLFSPALNPFSWVIGWRSGAEHAEEKHGNQ